jgi:hypothetical protein
MAKQGDALNAQKHVHFDQIGGVVTEQSALDSVVAD